MCDPSEGSDVDVSVETADKKELKKGVGKDDRCFVLADVLCDLLDAVDAGKFRDFNLKNVKKGIVLHIFK